MSMGKPESCGMGNGNCFDIIGAWTVGVSGECFHDNIGFRLGQHGYKYGVLQVWHHCLQHAILAVPIKHLHANHVKETHGFFFLNITINSDSI
jgi:hypothetical protein